MTSLVPDSVGELLQIEARAAPSRFARGWHCVGLTRELGDGKPHAVNAFDGKLVVFPRRGRPPDMVDRFEFEIDTTRPRAAWLQEVEENIAANRVPRVVRLLTKHDDASG